MQDLKFTTAGAYMNNLTQLKQQAGIQDNPDQEGLDLFAELIVQECIEIADKAEPYKATDLIKKHFGIGKENE
jgi:hypothetical protein